jgi:hypothetical protein
MVIRTISSPPLLFPPPPTHPSAEQCVKTTQGGLGRARYRLRCWPRQRACQLASIATGAISAGRPPARLRAALRREAELGVQRQISRPSPPSASRPGRMLACIKVPTSSGAGGSGNHPMEEIIRPRRLGLPDRAGRRHCQPLQQASGADG